MKIVKWSLSVLVIILVAINLSAQKPDISIQKGHVKDVKAISVSKDNKYFASCDFGTVIIWDVASLREIRTFFLGAFAINDIKFLPDNQHIAVGVDKIVYIVNINSGNKVKELINGHEGRIESVAVSPDGKYILSTSSKQVSLWNAASGNLVKRFDFKYIFECFELAAFSDNSKYFILGGHSKDLCEIWSVDDLNKPKASFKEKSNNLGFRFSDNDYFGSFGFYGYWNEQEKRYHMLAGKYTNRTSLVNDMQVASSSLDGSSVISTTFNAVYFEIKGKLPRRTVRVGKSIEKVQLSADGKLAFIMTRMYTPHEVFVYNTESGELIKKLPRNLYFFSEIAISNDVSYLAATTNSDSILVVKNLNSVSDLSVYNSTLPSVESLEIIPGKNQVVMSDFKKDDVIYDLNSNQIIQSFDLTQYGSPYCFSPDNKYMAFYKNDEYAYIYDIAASKIIKKIGKGNVKRTYFKDMTFSHDGKRLVFKSYNYDTKNGKGNGHSVYAWDIEKDELAVKYYEGKCIYDHFDVTKNGKYVVASGKITYEEGINIKIWDQVTGNLKHTIEGHTDEILKLCITSDDKYIISGSKDKTIKFWDIETGKLVYTYDNKLAVWDMDITKDGKYLAIYNNTKGITFLDVKKREPVYNLMLFNTPSNDWIIQTPDGYYMASRNATELMYYYQNNTFYSFDQFDIYYNRPDIVLERIGNASKEVINTYYAAAKKRLLKMNFSKDQADEILSGKFSKEFAAPKVVFGEGVTSVSRTNSDKISFSFKAFDPKNVPLDKIYVNINGVPVYGKSGLKVESANKEEINHKVENLALSNGRNVIEVYVLNKNGISSLRERFDVINENPTVKPDLYLVTIGVSKYNQKDYNLRYAAKDSKDITKTFGKNVSGLYNEVVEINLTDKNATKENILAVKETLKNTKVNDQVILFFAGHGLVSENLDYYLATYDVDFENPEANGLLYDDFENIIDNIPARNRLIMMDACHSGEIEEESEFVDKPVAMNEVKTNNFRGMKRKSIRIKTGDITQLLRSTFHDLRQGTGAIVITS